MLKTSNKLSKEPGFEYIYIFIINKCYNESERVCDFGLRKERKRPLGMQFVTKKSLN